MLSKVFTDIADVFRESQAHTSYLYPWHLCQGVYTFRLSVHSCIRHIHGIYHKFSTELRESFSSGVYLTNYSSESIRI